MGAFEETKIRMLPRAALTVVRRRRQPAILERAFHLLFAISALCSCAVVVVVVRCRRDPGARCRRILSESFSLRRTSRQARCAVRQPRHVMRRATSTVCSVIHGWMAVPCLPHVRNKQNDTLTSTSLCPEQNNPQSTTPLILISLPLQTRRVWRLSRPERRIGTRTPQPRTMSGHFPCSQASLRTHPRNAVMKKTIKRTRLSQRKRVKTTTNPCSLSVCLAHQPCLFSLSLLTYFT